METLNPEVLSRFSQQQGEPVWLTAHRRKLWEQSLTLPPPNLKYGITIALRTALDLDVIDYRAALQNGTTISVIDSTATNGAIVADFRTALRTHETLIHKHLFSTMQVQNRIDAIHQALFSNPMLVYVPKGVTVQLPIQLKNHVRAKLHCEHLLIIAEPNSQVTIVEETESHPQHPVGALHTKVVEAIVGDGAVVNYSAIQNLNTSTMHFTKKRAVVGKNATMNWLDCAIGGKLAQVEVTTELNGEGANSSNWNMFFGTGQQQFDLGGTVIHHAPHTTSDMLTKGAVTDHAKAIYRGLIKIGREAKNANGFQRADTLLLSDTAEADNIPALEIDNAEVKCSHASTIGQIDEEQLFYLQSRGIPEPEARTVLIRAMFAPLIARIPAEPMQNLLRKIIEERV